MSARTAAPPTAAPEHHPRTPNAHAGTGAPGVAPDPSLPPSRAERRATGLPKRGQAARWTIDRSNRSHGASRHRDLRTRFARSPVQRAARTRPAFTCSPSSRHHHRRHACEPQRSTRPSTSEWRASRDNTPTSVAAPASCNGTPQKALRPCRPPGGSHHHPGAFSSAAHPHSLHKKHHAPRNTRRHPDPPQAHPQPESRRSVGA